MTLDAKKKRDTSPDDSRLVDSLAQELLGFVDWLDNLPMRKPTFGDMRMIANRVERLHEAAARRGRV